MRDRKDRPEGGEWEPIKNLANRSFGFVPTYTPNPRVLGTAWSSYREAIPTQESPRNKREQTNAEANTKSSAKQTRYMNTG